MKKIIVALIMVIFVMIPIENSVFGQAEPFQFINDTTCSTGDCEVWLRQYTGIYVGYRISVRCMDSGGNFGSWQVNSYSGVYPGTICGG